MLDLSSYIILITLSERIRAQRVWDLSFSKRVIYITITNLKFSCLLVVIIIDIMFKCGSLVFNLSARLYYVVTQTLSLWYLLELPSEAR